MDLFKKLDEFCNACELIQDKAVGERSCFVDDIHQTIRNTDELVITCDRIQADYKYLQSEVNKLKSEFFSDEVTDIKQKFETVEHLYLKVVRHLKDQLDYLNLYRSIYETCVNVRSTLNGPAYKDLHKLTDFERKGIRGNMEDLYLRVLGEQFSLAELHQLNTTVEVKVYGDTQHYHLHNLDNFVRETLLNIRNLWDAISDGTVTLESVVEKRKKMAEKEKSLKAKLVALKLRYDQSRIPLSETNLNTALNDLIERLEEISSELVSNISNYESFLVEMGLSRNDWPNKELQKNCTALEQNLQRRISTLSSNLQRHNSYNNTTQKIRNSLDNADLIGSNPGTKVEEAEAVLAELKGLDPDFRLIKRESVMLQEILRESPTLARQTNFFDEIERLDRDWRKAVSDLDEIYMKLLSEQIDVPGLNEKLKLCENSLLAEQKVFEKYKHTEIPFGDFLEKLQAQHDKANEFIRQLDEIGKLLEILRSLDLKEIRLRYLNCRNNWGKLDESILELKTCLERLEKFIIWLKEYKNSVSSVPRLTHNSSQAQEVHSNLKWQLDLGLTRELTLQQIGDKEKEYPVVKSFVTPVSNDYYKIINGLKADLNRLDGTVNLHKRFKTLYDQCDHQLTTVEIDIRSVEFLLDHQMSVNKDRLDVLVETLAKLKALEPKITEAFHIAQELQNEQTDVEGNLQISQALDLKERCKTLREKNLSLSNELDKNKEIDAVNAKKLDSHEAWLSKIRSRFENTLQISDPTRKLVELKLLLADMKGKKRETEDLHSIMSNSKDPSVRARSQKFLMDFNILQNDIQDEIENLTSHADKMKSYQELRDKLRQKLREMDALFGQFERDFKLTGHSNIDLKAINGKLREAKTDLTQLTDLQKSASHSLSSEANENQRKDLRDIQKDIDKCDGRLRDAEKLAATPKTPPSKLPIPVERKKPEPTEGLKSPVVSTIPVYHPSIPNARLKKETDYNLFKLPEIKVKPKEPEISTEDKEILRKLKELEDFTLNFKRILTDASGFKCQLENLPGKLQLLKALEAQRPHGDDLLKRLEAEFNSGRKFDPELKRRFSNLKYDWLAANGKLSSAKLNLKILMDDGDAIKSVLKRIEDGLSGVMSNVRGPVTCSCLNDKIAHKDKLKANLNTLKNLKLEADGVDESVSNLTHSGIQSPLLSNDIKQRIKNASGTIEMEIDNWTQAINQHNSYNSVLKSTDETLDGMGPVLAAFNLKTPENIATTNAWLIELDNLKCSGGETVENSEDLLPGALRHMSKSAAEKMKKHQHDTTSYWQDFLLPMIEATEHRLQWQLTHPGTSPKLNRSGDRGSLDRSQMKPKRESLENLEDFNSHQEHEHNNRNGKDLRKSESGYATGHQTPNSPNTNDNLPDDVVIRNFEKEPRGPNHPRSTLTETSFGVNPPARRSDSWSRVDLIGDNQSDPSVSVNIEPWEAESLRSKSALSEANQQRTQSPSRHSRQSLKRSDSWEKLDILEENRPIPEPIPFYEKEVPLRTEKEEKPQPPYENQDENLTGLLTEAQTATTNWDMVEFAGWQYEDKFIKLTPDWLMVKSNLFPFRQPQIIYPADLDEVFFIRDFPNESDTQPRRTRGLFWAADCCYTPQKKSANIAVKSERLGLNSTFSVRDVDKFLSILKPMLNDGCAIVCQE